jgi:AcrR family transcriptional regulator
MTDAARPAPSRKSNSTRGQWLAAAQDALIHTGVDGVRPEAVAAILGVDAADFFQHFDDHAALLSALVTAWEGTALRPIQAIDATPEADAFERFETFMATWVDSEPHSPVYDSAIRHWAQIDDEVASRVRKIDDERIARLTQIFRELGHEQEEAFIRARITYFHQIGYYALGVKETRESRRQYWPLYMWILTGR